MLETNRIINGDCVVEMGKLPESIIDLIVTSPPYNVGIDYDSHDDNQSMEEYWKFTEKWVGESFRVLKDDGRIAVNIPYEINVQDRGGRVLFMSEFWSVMKKVGFKFYGLVDLDENAPHRSKTTAWGSWMSPSSPYIYNPKECVILAYKKDRIKKVKGETQWEFEVLDVEQEDGSVKKKTVYKEEDKKEFMSLVYGQWEYFADTKQQTKATFSMDIPWKAIKILSYKEDVIMDPFNGSGTTCLAAEMLGRSWIGVDISPNYCEVARKRVREYQLQQNQLEIQMETPIK